MSTLERCTDCHRHVRANEAACPFCGSDASRASAPTGAPRHRAGRAAVLLAGAALAASVASGCDDAPGGTDAGTDTSVVAPYGTPALLDTVV